MASPGGRGTPVRVALAGAGMISWYHLVAWRSLGPRARVVAVCDPDRQKASRQAEEFGIPRVQGEGRVRGRSIGPRRGGIVDQGLIE